jgi:hypothetical protein
MIPLSEAYYKDSVKSVANTMFVVYRDTAYPPSLHQYPMCYNAAKGKIFQEIFGITKIDEIPILIKQWSEKNMGWATDELLLYAYLNRWKDFDTRCIRLNHTVSRRIDRANWQYNASWLVSGYYIDCHSLRPYNRFKAEIDTIIHLFGLDNTDL